FEILKNYSRCWLNYETHFIWSFIGPVILIIIANIGFFVMSICIMRSHQKKKIHNKETNQIKHWMKVSLSLTIIMGISWIGNVLFFSKELIFIAYIMTIFIVGQGIIIFILYVPLSSHVRKHIVCIAIMKVVCIITLSQRRLDVYLIFYYTYMFLYMHAYL
ncbi:PREDICTED: adhesion G protein-coupled receptor L2-like, partial [Amphimedon queenslandica]|uniref:G-protein coupled receptors family 2 profile 2 domain-containing protein n=2 Tax=Amphimedon queenslandica TaxID=400682 RepID=A0AAN0JP02_AMPQE